MAKAEDIPVDPSEPFAHAAARSVRVRGRELIAHAANVLDTEDIERVHDMRVASRRLRAVLEIFAPCFPRDEHRSVLRDVKRLADALGERRDPDVHIAALTELAARVPEAQRPGVMSLVTAQEAAQARGNERLSAELERMRSTGLDGRIRALADAAG